MDIYTIGFTRKSAEQFFGILREAGIKRLIDIRLSNQSQLAGFTKQDDLRFFLAEILQADYMHRLDLAPTADLMNYLRRQGGAWEVFRNQFQALLAERRIEETLPRELFSVPAVLLCSEATPEHCHRRLVAEYLAAKWPDVHITHL